MRKPVIPSISGVSERTIQEIRRHLSRLYEEANDVRRMVFTFSEVTTTQILMGQDWPLLRSTQFLRLGYRFRYTGAGGDTIDVSLDSNKGGAGWATVFTFSATPGAAGPGSGVVTTVTTTGADFCDVGDEWRIDVDADAAAFYDVGVEVLYSDWTPRLR
jgi:hypothetical protein